MFELLMRPEVAKRNRTKIVRTYAMTVLMGPALWTALLIRSIWSFSRASWTSPTAALRMTEKRKARYETGLGELRTGLICVSLL